MHVYYIQTECIGCEYIQIMLTNVLIQIVLITFNVSSVLLSVQLAIERVPSNAMVSAGESATFPCVFFKCNWE